MPALTGYVDRWSVKPGGTIRFMVSSADGHDFALRFVRHVCADPNPAGPGYAEISMASPFDAMQPGKAQPAYLGSFGHVASLPADLQTGVSLSATIWPTTPGKGRQGLVALRINGWTFALGIGPGGGAMAEVVGPDGTVRAEVPCRLLERRWYDVKAILDRDGTISVTQAPHSPMPARHGRQQRAPLSAPQKSSSLHSHPRTLHLPVVTTTASLNVRPSIVRRLRTRHWRRGISPSVSPRSSSPIPAYTLPTLV